MTVRWGSLIASPEGEIDYTRLTRLIALLLGLAGGLALILAMAGLIHPSEYVTLGTSALVLPITAGKVADAIANRAAGASGGPA